MSKEGKIVSINRLQIIGNGIHGCIAFFGVDEKYGDYNYDSDIKKRHRVPVPSRLMNEMKKLNIHLLRMYGSWALSNDKYYDFLKDQINEKEIKALRPEQQSTIRQKLASCVVSEVAFGSSGYMIMGRTKRTNGPLKSGDVMIKLCSEIIKEEDGYDKYEELSEIMSNIASMTTDYLNGKMLASTTEVAFMAYTEKSLDIEADIKAFKDLSKEEMDELVEKHLSKTGKVAVEMTDLLNPNSDIEEKEGEEEEKEIPVKEEKKALQENDTVKEKVKVSATKKVSTKKVKNVDEEEAVIIPSEDDDDENF